MNKNPLYICNFPKNSSESRRFFHRKKKFNNRFAPFAPRNTTSYIIRAKRSGGIASPVTPAVPIFSPSPEVLVDTVKEEWGVDGYGSMKGLIRLKSVGQVEERERERRLELDHDLSRFEMIFPASVLESRVDDQDEHLVRLEEENLTVKKRLFLMESDLEDLRRRIYCLERDNNGGHVSENASENEGGGGEVRSEKSVGDGDCDS